MVLLALLMERLLSVYWFVKNNRDQTIFINCYIWVYGSIVIAFYIFNLGRMLASWIL